MNKKCISPFSLKFIDPKFETQFNTYKQEAQRSKFKYILFSIGAIALHGSFTGKRFSELSLKKEGVSAIMTFIFFVAIYKISLKWLKRYLENVITFIILISIIIPSELPKSQWNRIIFFSCGSIIQLFTCIFLLYNIPFRKNIFVLPFCMIYPVWRFAQTGEMEEFSFYSNNTAVLNLIILISLNYYSEKQFRLTFFAQHSYQISLENFKQVLKTVIPHGILIVRKGNIIFANDACKSLFPNEFNENSSFSTQFLETITIEREQLTGEASENNVNVIEQFDRRVDNLMTLLNDMESQNTGYEDSFEKFLNISAHYHKIVNLNQDKSGESLKKIIPLDVLLGKLLWDNESSYMIMLSNTSAKKRIRFLKELAKYKDRLLATVSHDLRTPLNGVLGILQILFENPLGHDAKKLLQICIRSANLLLYMINDILDFSQISNGKLRLNVARVRDMAFVKDMVKIIKFQAKRKGINFIYENLCESIEERNLNTDINRVKQVLLNLLGNALKFTMIGSIHLKVFFTTLENREAVLFQVKDTGIGIKKEDIPRLFKLFGKLEQNNKEINSGGVGLGLAISQNLVRMLNGNESGGEITVKSEYGVGTEFCFPLLLDENSSEINQSGNDLIPEELKITKMEEKKVRIFDEKISKDLTKNSENQKFTVVERTINDNSKTNILIVDDDPINILVACKYIESFGSYNYETSYNGKDALEKLLLYARKGIYFEIVLMDCNMPVMNGYEASTKINEMVKNNELKNLKIIALTANVTEEDKEICLRSGMNYFMSKPVNKSELEAKLESLLSKKESNL